MAVTVAFAVSLTVVFALVALVTEPPSVIVQLLNLKPISGVAVISNGVPSAMFS